jgi:MFS transporter, Spinster family, sphingosine-1-phosphate transporter
MGLVFAPDAAPLPSPSPARAPGALGLVAAVAALNVLSYVDRQLMVALAPLLIADLGLTHAQIGLLIGGPFIVVFAAGILVVGVLADRYNRPRLIALGLIIWSAATALTSTASGLVGLAFCRFLVGVGEAGLPPTALSMVSDRVPPRHLGVATSVFYAGVPVGFALSFALSGVLGPRLGWRACFLALGATGLACAMVVPRIQDPPRRDGGAAAASGTLASALGERPMLVALTVAAVLLVYTSAASQHAISWLVADRGFDYARAAFLSAAVILAAGLLGSLLIGTIADRARRAHPAGRLLALAGVSAVGLAGTGAFYSLPPAGAAFYASWFLAQAYLLGWYGALVAAVDERAPAGRRAAVLGFLLLTINVAGVATGTYVTGLVADRPGSSLTHALVWSLVPGAVGALILAAAGVVEWRAAAGSRRVA